MMFIAVEGREAGGEMDRLAWMGMGYGVLEGGGGLTWTVISVTGGRRREPDGA